MISKKEQFVLALRGWSYIGIIDDWYFERGRFGGAIRHERQRILIPEILIIKQTEHAIILRNKIYYELGDKEK